MGNQYLDRQKAKQTIMLRVAQEIATQYAVDCFTVLLHERGYGAERMTALLKDFAEMQEKFLVAFDPKEPEADYYREVLDRELRAIYGSKADPFEVRYPAAYDILYDKPFRDKPLKKKGHRHGK